MQQTPRHPDEIDLVQFFSLVSKGLRRFGIRFLRILQRLVTKQARTFLILFMTFLTGSLGFAWLNRNVYQSTMLIHCDYFDASVAEKVFSNLKTTIDDPYLLSKTLNISISLAKKIKDVKFTAVQPAEESILTVRRRLVSFLEDEQPGDADRRADLLGEISKYDHSFEITIHITDKSVYDSLNGPMLGFLARHSFIDARKKERSKRLSAMRSKLLAESAKIDSLKNNIYNNYVSIKPLGKTGSNNIILAEEPPLDPVKILHEGIAIYERILEINSQLSLASDLEIIYPFQTAEKLKVYGYTAMMKKSLIVALLLTVVWFFVLECHAILQKHDQKLRDLRMETE